ncbi:MAG: ABC transporter transmembrane domain-containing protein [Bacteroidales bacterium]
MFKRSFFFRYLSPYTGRIVFNVFLRTLAAVFTVVLLLCIAPMLSLLFSDGSLIQSAEPGQSALSENLIDLMKNWVNMSVQCYGKNKTLLLITWTLMFLYFLKNTFSYLGLYYFTPIRNGVVASLRNDLYIRLIILPLSFFSVHKKGDLMSRLSSDLQEIDENILKQIQQVLIDIVTFLFMLAALFFISTPLTLFVLFILPIAGISTGFLSKSLRRSSPKQQASLGRLTSQLEESIQGIKTIRSYNTTSFSIAKFKQENTVFNNLKIQVCHRVDLSSPVSEFIGTIAIVGLLILGGYFILGSESTSISPEAFITYLVTLTQILPSSKNIATAYYGLQRGKGSVARIKDILYADEVITQKENALAIKDLTHNIEFRHVGFTYHNDEVLHDINLIIPKGKNI